MNIVRLDGGMNGINTYECRLIVMDVAAVYVDRQKITNSMRTVIVKR